MGEKVTPHSFVITPPLDSAHVWLKLSLSDAVRTATYYTNFPATNFRGDNHGRWSRTYMCQIFYESVILLKLPESRAGTPHVFSTLLYVRVYLRFLPDLQYMSANISHNCPTHIADFNLSGGCFGTDII